ncbi:MAG: hypothetical protein R2855_04655 [Thermomicrobiales bacterium]
MATICAANDQSPMLPMMNPSTGMGIGSAGIPARGGKPQRTSDFRHWISVSGLNIFTAEDDGGDDPEDECDDRDANTREQRPEKRIRHRVRVAIAKLDRLASQLCELGDPESPVSTTTMAAWVMALGSRRTSSKIGRLNFTDPATRSKNRCDGCADAGAGAGGK